MAFTVGIAGCGVAGLAAALLLAQRGHRVTIHEQSRRLGPAGAGVLLQPSGQAVLRVMGLLDAVVADAEPIARLAAFTHRRKTLIDLPYGELQAGACAYGLLRGELFNVLHAQALAAGVTICEGHRITRYTCKDEPGRGGLESGGVYFEDDQKNSHGPYHFVLAADGARSAIRENSPIKSHVHAYPHGALWTMGPCQHVRSKLLQICRGTRELCGILPTGHSQASLFWSVRNDEKEGLRQRGLPAWRKDVIALCPEAGELFEAIPSFDAVQFVSYMHVYIPKPFDDHCLFLGDAAHAMSPHLGQGINLALIDAFIFARALDAHGNFHDACRHFTRQRAAHLRAYRIITYMLSPFFQSRGVIKGIGRDIFLPLMPKVPVLRKQMVRTMAGCRASLRGGVWALPVEKMPRPAAGFLQAARPR